MIDRIYVTIGDVVNYRKVLYDNNGPIDLSGEGPDDIHFLWGKRGSSARTSVGCTLVTDGTDGQVEVQITAPTDVDDAGIYVAWFDVVIGVEHVTVPNGPDKILLVVSPN